MTLVRYLATPVDLFIELQEGLDAFQREAQIADLDGSVADVDDVVVEGLVRQRDGLMEVRVRLIEQAMAARDGGRAVIDLEAEYPDDAAERVRTIKAASHRAHEVAEDGRLLSPPFRSELRHFQEWVFAELEAQLDGGAPTAYVAP